MPQVFSPGEAETRPLDPTAIVYTTAQKVADLLDIGPQEAVLMSKDADSDAIYITGADYRNIGFSVGDKIRVYSDADPLGEEDLSITAIGKGASSKAGSVKLTFSGTTLTATDYEVADNGYVQNQASFTNGRTRGLTKDKVDAIIRRMQDKIDNMTHNSWRPNLVTAEYINFDTYKPYRRRYYTDYVGTTPLLYRNVQQILRLELWQGDDYREIGAAEARIIIPDSVNTLSGSIVLCPGNSTASTVTLTMGTASNQWRADFDKITTAQNLADLINKEDRVGKAGVDFSPAFTLEGSTANVAVNNEFLATANADLGSGIVKITSMRPIKGGETCTIASTNSNLTIDAAISNTAVVNNATTSVLTVNTVDGDGNVTTKNTTSDFVDSGVLSVGDTVIRYTGKTSNVLDANGNVTSHGTFTGCSSVVGSSVDDLNGLTITQHKMDVDLQGSTGDGGRLRDFWLDPEMGIIYFNNSYPFFEWNAVKASYIYGERYLEKAIEDMCTKMVAIDLLMSDDRSVLIPEGTQNVDLASKIQMYKMDIENTIPRYKEVVSFL